jgi:hypothetical protein
MLIGVEIIYISGALTYFSHAFKWSLYSSGATKYFLHVVTPYSHVLVLKRRKQSNKIICLNICMNTFPLMCYSEFKRTSCIPPLAVSSLSITKFACQCVLLLKSL